MDGGNISSTIVKIRHFSIIVTALKYLYYQFLLSLFI